MSVSLSARLVRVVVVWNVILLAGGLLAVAATPRAAVSADASPDVVPTARAVRSLAADGVAHGATVEPATTPPPAPVPTSTPPNTTPPDTTPPAPVPAAVPAVPPSPPESPEQRVHRAYEVGVPPAWRAILPARLEVIAGSTSWARGDDTILIARSHASSSFEHLVDVVAHEYGHLIAFRHGTAEYPGAAPAGWPPTSDRPEEAWADCVQTAFTGRENPSHGLHPCRGDSLSWARSWLEQFPSTS